MRAKMALAIVFMSQGVFATPTTCKQKVEDATAADVRRWDPNGDGFVSVAEPILSLWSEDSGLPEDKDLHLWRVKEVSRPGEGLPTYTLYALTRGDQFGACTISQVIAPK